MKRPAARLLPLVLLLVFAGCKRSDPPLALDAGASTRRAKIFLIALDHGGISPKEGCGGKTAPVEVELPVPAPALEGSLKALLDAGKRYENAGLYNSLADSPLRIERIERGSDAAQIYLGGYLELAGECDGSNVLKQLTETATQFRDVGKAEFFLGGKPLRELLADKG